VPVAIGAVIFDIGGVLEITPRTGWEQRWAMRLGLDVAQLREREQAAYGFEEMCHAVVYSHEEGVKKPQRRFYEIVCERLGVQATEAIFLDDMPACVEAARQVGMTAITFVDNEQAIAEIQHRLTGRLS
jgi:hypothetical protein